MTNTITVTEQIDTKYREYSMYTIENRAIPSMVDGMKIVNRKLLFAAIKENAYTKELKCADLAGSLSRYEYLHGETSAADALIKMAQEFSNNLPLFKGHGNFGTRLVPIAAAPRYIYTTLNKTDVFTDHIILKERDEYNPEPLCYHTVLPLSLINGSVGIAVAYATLVLPRSVKSIAKALSKGLETAEYLTNIKPSLPQFRGNIDAAGDNRWIIRGIVDKSTSTRYIIEELPWGITREAYTHTLIKLMDDGKIVSFVDDCKINARFAVKVTREQAIEIDKNPEAFFYLKRIVVENFTLLDEHGKIRVYSGTGEILNDFIRYRMKTKKLAVDATIAKLQADVTIFTDKRNFISEVVKNRTILTDLPKLTDLAIQCNDKSFVKLSVDSFTDAKREQLDKEIQRVTDEIDELKSLSISSVVYKEFAEFA